MSDPTSPSPNLILAHLGPEDLNLLKPHLQPVELEQRQKIALANRDIEWVYFMESGFVSLVSSVRNDIPVEIGITGREGIANMVALLGTERTPHDSIVQIPGRALRMAKDEARSAMEQSAAFNLLVRQYGYLLMMQTCANVLANARATVSQRLARWLLMARDRVDDERMPLTHEFISFMLGVRRPAVTLALTSFEEADWISRARGEITLLDRQALVEEADGFYGAVEAERERLFGVAGHV